MQKYLLGQAGDIERSSEKKRNRYFQQIAKIVEMKNDISLQTDVLSINAQIEAAHAGGLGKYEAVAAASLGTDIPWLCRKNDTAAAIIWSLPQANACGSQPSFRWTHYNYIAFDF